MHRLVSVLVVVLAGCATPTGVDSGLLRVSAQNSAVTLSNYSAEPVSYIIATPSYLALADPAQCTRPSGCTASVAANATIEVAYAQIAGYQRGERTALVVHWRGLSGAAADSVHRLEITLR